MKPENLLQQFLTISALFVALATAQPSWALFGPGCQCSTISSYHTSTQKHVSRETTQTARLIIEALRAHSAQQSSYLDRQVEAHKRIVDGEQQNHSMRLRDQFRAEAESGRFDPNRDFCHLVDMARLPSNRIPLPVVQVITKAADGWSQGRHEIVRQNGVRMAAWLQQEKEQVGTIGNIEHPTTNWGLLTDHATIPINEPFVAEALTRLTANTVDPIPSIPLTSEDLQTPAGLSEAVVRDAIHARKQAAMRAIEYTIGMYLPQEPSDAYKTLSQLSQYDKDVPDEISLVQALDIRSMMYFAPALPTLDGRLAKNERALLQDLIDLNSLNTRINFLRLEQEARNSIVLAGILASITDNGYTNMTPR